MTDVEKMYVDADAGIRIIEWPAWINDYGFVNDPNFGIYPKKRETINIEGFGG